MNSATNTNVNPLAGMTEEELKANRQKQMMLLNQLVCWRPVMITPEMIDSLKVPEDCTGEVCINPQKSIYCQTDNGIDVFYILDEEFGTGVKEFVIGSRHFLAQDLMDETGLVLCKEYGDIQVAARIYDDGAVIAGNFVGKEFVARACKG